MIQKTNTGYYTEIYNKMLNFHKQHANATTETDWKNIINQLNEFKTPFERAFATAIVEEIEREFYKRNGPIQQKL